MLTPFDAIFRKFRCPFRRGGRSAEAKEYQYGISSVHVPHTTAPTGPYDTFVYTEIQKPSSKSKYSNNGYRAAEPINGGHGATATAAVVQPSSAHYSRPYVRQSEAPVPIPVKRSRTYNASQYEPSSAPAPAPGMAHQNSRHPTSDRHHREMMMRERTQSDVHFPDVNSNLNYGYPSYPSYAAYQQNPPPPAAMTTTGTTTMNPSYYRPNPSVPATRSSNYADIHRGANYEREQAQILRSSSRRDSNYDQGQMQRSSSRRDRDNGHERVREERGQTDSRSRNRDESYGRYASAVPTTTHPRADGKERYHHRSSDHSHSKSRRTETSTTDRESRHRSKTHVESPPPVIIFADPNDERLHTEAMMRQKSSGVSFPQMDSGRERSRKRSGDANHQQRQSQIADTTDVIAVSRSRNGSHASSRHPPGLPPPTDEREYYRTNEANDSYKLATASRDHQSRGPRGPNVDSRGRPEYHDSRREAHQQGSHPTNPLPYSTTVNAPPPLMNSKHATRDPYSQHVSSQTHPADHYRPSHSSVPLANSMHATREPYPQQVSSKTQSSAAANPHQPSHSSALVAQQASANLHNSRSRESHQEYAQHSSGSRPQSRAQRDRNDTSHSSNHSSKTPSPENDSDNSYRTAYSFSNSQRDGMNSSVETSINTKLSTSDRYYRAGTPHPNFNARIRKISSNQPHDERTNNASDSSNQGNGTTIQQPVPQYAQPTVLNRSNSSSARQPSNDNEPLIFIPPNLQYISYSPSGREIRRPPTVENVPMYVFPEDREFAEQLFGLAPSSGAVQGSSTSQVPVPQPQVVAQRPPPVRSTTRFGMAHVLKVRDLSFPRIDWNISYPPSTHANVKISETEKVSINLDEIAFPPLRTRAPTEVVKKIYVNFDHLSMVFRDIEELQVISTTNSPLTVGDVLEGIYKYVMTGLKGNAIKVIKEVGDKAVDEGYQDRRWAAQRVTPKIMDPVVNGFRRCDLLLGTLQFRYLEFDSCFEESRKVFIFLDQAEGPRRPRPSAGR